jgi:hypothetical protein
MARTRDRVEVLVTAAAEQQKYGFATAELGRQVAQVRDGVGGL